MSCFQIVHSTVGQEIWRQGSKKRNKFFVDQQHSIIVQLKRLRKVTRTTRKRQRKNDSGSDNDDNDDEGEEENDTNESNEVI